MDNGPSFQMVDKLDQGLVPPELGPLDYTGLYNVRVLLILLDAHLCHVIAFGVFAFRLFPKHFFEPM